MKNLHGCVGFILGLLWLLIAGVATAGGYKIIQGKGEELCEACLENLLRQSAEDAVCEWQYSSNLGLRKVEWAPLNLADHVELLMRMNPLAIRGQESGKGLFANLREAQEYANGGADGKRPPLIVLETADVDFDHDGIPDRMLRYEVRTCKRAFSGFHSRYASMLVVLQDGGEAVNYPKTDLLWQYPLLEDLKARRGDIWREGLPDLMMYQVFTYKGLVYFDRWDGGSGPDTNTLSIYEVRQGHTRRVCHIRLFPPDGVPHN